MTINKNLHLEKVLETNDINKLENLDRYIEKKNDVKDALATHYSDKKASDPIDSGSYAKGTAINRKFDIDCCIPFKKKTSEEEKGFETLKEMYDNLYDYLRNTYSNEDKDLDKEDVRKQKVSIGLLFKFEDGDEFELDVVPGREIPNHGDYNDDNTELSLYIDPSKRSKKEEEENKERIKTNIKTHVNLMSGELFQKKVARLLKVWKTTKKEKDGGKLIKSFVMEVYTKEAFDKNKGNIPSGLWNKTKMVMEHIIENIEDKDLVDPANSSNIISDSMSNSAKNDTKKSMKKTIKEIEEDNNNIKEHFPINEDYNDEEDKSESALHISRSGVVQKPWHRC